MNVLNRINSVKKIRLLSLLLFLGSYSITAQIPKKAFAIADSVLQTRITCSHSEFKFGSTFSHYTGKSEEMYQFYYTFHPRKDYALALHISIKDDFSEIRVAGVPEKGYRLSACAMKPRKELWRIAKDKGLKTSYKNCSYSVTFEEDRILVKFNEKRRKFFNSSEYHDVDYFAIDGLTGVFIEHRVFTFTF